ncbi:MAG: maleylpyruvate isomerase family mycothiol-dependent enzyme [Propionicimonas sp.]|nr:maleylpyruvate isomerase family mycothiol-dependent enzyme [Propionicimonas sp.]
MSRDHLAALHAYQDDFLASIALADPSAPVRSCGDWTVADLVLHLAEIHLWAAAKASGSQETALANVDTDSPRQLAKLYGQCAAVLRDTLARLDPDAPAWTLTDQGLPEGAPRTGTVGFWHRRQALETLIHTWDLHTAAGLGYDPGDEGWLDCVDEVVTVMHPRQLRLGRIAPPAVRVRFHTAAADAGELAGADPAAPAVTVSGPAKTLALLVWGRADSDDPALAIAGDRAGLDAVLAQGLTP